MIDLGQATSRRRKKARACQLIDSHRTGRRLSPCSSVKLGFPFSFVFDRCGVAFKPCGILISTDERMVHCVRLGRRMAANHSSLYDNLRLTFGSGSQAEPRSGDFDGWGLYWRVSLDVLHNGWGKVWLCVVGLNPAHQFGEVSISAGGHTFYGGHWIDVVGGVSAP